MESRLIHGDCLEMMPTLAAGSADSIVTDPPYGLVEPRSGSDWKAGQCFAPRTEAMKAKRRGGFMGKKWDAGVPGPEYWAAALHVVRPGGYMLCFGGTRTYHRLACAIEDAGWEIRDCINWLYGSGFPKGKGCLKPAWEPILLARAPGPKVLPLQIDACRVEGVMNGKWGLTQSKSIGYGGTEPNGYQTEQHPAGRWPANVIHDGGEEVVEAFAAYGDRPSGGGIKSKAGSVIGNGNTHGRMVGAYNNPDSGSAARFFYCAKSSRRDRNEGLEELPLREVRHYSDDATPRRNGASSGGALTNGTGYPTPQRNHHPTVKPTALMRYLCRLVTPPGGTVLDPFMGSGSTGKAARLEGFRFVGIEKEAEYIAIAEKRIAAAQSAAPLFAGAS